MRKTARISDRRVPLPLVLLLAAAGACGSNQPTPEPSPTNAAAEIVAMLEASAEAWNRDDLDGFLTDYAVDATFVGAAGLIRGVDEIRRRYVDGYWSSGTPADRLAFEIIDVRVTSPSTATVVGRYILRDRRSNERSGTGIFTLLLARNTDGWAILHDHSSADEGN